MRRLPVLILLAFMLGLGLGTYGQSPSWAWALPLCLLAWKLPRARGAFLCAAFCWAGMLYIGQWRAARAAVPSSGKEVEFKAVVVEPPDIRPDKTFLTVQPERPEPAFSRGSGKLLLKAERFPAYAYGDELDISGGIEVPQPVEGFDYPLYLERFGIYGVISRPGRIQLVGRDEGNGALASLYAFRGRLEEAVQRYLPEPESSFLNGILLGSKRAIPASVTAALQATGTSHIIAISGANITILLGILLGALPLASPKHQLALTACIAGFVTLLTGSSASVMRGALAACFGRYLRLHSRQAWPAPYLALTSFLLLLGNPLMLTADAGFQLSFGAFFGLAYLGTPCSDLLERWALTKRLPEAVRGPLAETVAATIGTAPISAFSFGSFSPLGIAVNPLILWMLPPITLLGLLLLAFSWLPPAAQLIRLPLWLLLHAVLSIIRSFAKLSSATGAAYA